MVIVPPLNDHTYCAWSAFTHFWALAKSVRLFIASLHNQPVCSHVCCLGIFVDVQPYGCNLKRELCNQHQFGGLDARGGCTIVMLDIASGQCASYGAEDSRYLFVAALRSVSFYGVLLSSFQFGRVDGQKRYGECDMTHKTAYLGLILNNWKWQWKRSKLDFSCCDFQHKKYSNSACILKIYCYEFKVRLNFVRLGRILLPFALRFVLLRFAQPHQLVGSLVFI